MEIIGACRFCGQTKLIQIEDMDEETAAGLADNIVTGQCNCKDGQKYAGEMERRNKIRKTIEDIFREEPEQADFVLAAAHAVMSGAIMKCTIDILDMKYSFYMKGDRLICGRRKVIKRQEEF